MAWKKGESGNPGGRPRKERELIEIAEAASPAALQRVVALTKSRNPRVALAAAQEILNRAIGKPRQQLEHKIADGQALRITVDLK